MFYILKETIQRIRQEGGISMNKRFLLSALLVCSFTLMSNAYASAQTSGSAVITGNLCAMKQVCVDGGNKSTTIDPGTGALACALNPTFIITTNSSSSMNLTLSAMCNTTGSPVNALSGTGAAGATFISMTNNNTLPTVAAVSNAQSASPTAINNPNVIAYPVTPPSNISGQLAYTWDTTNKRYDAVLTHSGMTATSFVVPAGAPKPSTFSSDDQSGPYQATVTLSFV